MKYLVSVSKENGEIWAKKLNIKDYLVISDVSDLENPEIDYSKEKRFIFIEGDKYGTPEVHNGRYDPNFMAISELVEDRIDRELNE
jgi:hypothetical protein